MKIIYLTAFISIFSLCKKAQSVGDTSKTYSKDTLYIFLQTDNKYNNKISTNKDSLSYSIYGFVRNNKPKDRLDSLGHLTMYIGVEKDTLAFCIECSCKQYLESKMISMYDLRDTLKPYLMVFEKRRKSLVDAFPLLKRKTVILVTESNFKYYLRKVKYLSGFTRASD